jgi:hypothetical protein
MQKPEPPTGNGDPRDEDPAADSFVHDATSQVPPQMHSNMNGGMPPQQVYVDNMGQPNVAGLDTQFQALGIQPEEGINGQGHEHDPEEDIEDEGNDEGGDGEDDPLKLFVGQVSNDRRATDVQYHPMPMYPSVALVMS